MQCIILFVSENWEKCQTEIDVHRSAILKSPGKAADADFDLGMGIRGLQLR